MCHTPWFAGWISVRAPGTRWKSTERGKGLQLLARLAQGCDPVSWSLQPVPALSEAACSTLAPVQPKVSPTTSCSLSSAHCLLEQRDYPPCILPDLCNGPLGFLALVRFSLNFRVRAGLCGSRSTRAQDPSLFASRPGGRMWNLHVRGGGREGKFGIMCKTIKMLLTGNLKQWRVLLFLQIHELKTAANDGKC